MKNSEIYGLPYIEAGDLVEDIAGQSKQFVEGVESVMLSSDFRGPQGEPGEQGAPGLPGVNAVPTDEAVAAYATAPDTATRAALDGRYGDAATAARVADEASATGAAVRALAAGSGGASDDSVAAWIAEPSSASRGAVQAAINAASPALVADAKAYTDTLVGNQVDVMADKNTLALAFALPGAVVSSGTAYNLKPGFGSNFTVFEAPFPMKIVSVSLIQSVATIPVDTTNYMYAIWRKLAVDGTTFTNVATKRTNATAWTVHKPWKFDNETQVEAAKTLQTGESLNLLFSVAGTGYYQFPINVSVRYLPL